MPRTLSSATQGAIVLSAFLVPVLTYLYFTRSQNKTTKASAGPLPPPTEIEALYIHPIKSCHGISVKTAKLLPTGFDLGNTNLSFSSSILLTSFRPPMDVGILSLTRVPNHPPKCQNDAHPALLRRLHRHPDRHRPSPQLPLRKPLLHHPSPPYPAMALRKHHRPKIQNLEHLDGNPRLLRIPNISIHEILLPRNPPRLQTPLLPDPTAPRLQRRPQNPRPLRINLLPRPHAPINRQRILPG